VTRSGQARRRGVGRLVAGKTGASKGGGAGGADLVAELWEEEDERLVA
jgi:hypothetical protein